MPHGLNVTIPKVSVITPTWQRHELLLDRALPSLEAQTFQDFQHVIVSDGPDDSLCTELYGRNYRAFGDRVFVELGRNWHGFFGGDGEKQAQRGTRGASTEMVGTYLAAGQYIAYLDDDCAYKPNHLQALVDLLDVLPTTDFAYSQMERIVQGEFSDIVGDGFVEFGHIDGNMILHRPRLLRLANWKRSDHNPFSDWEMIATWVAAGARSIFHPEVTVTWHKTEDQ